ncbi:MAG: GHKL domain-containing protein [Bacteroidaceae bacterium]|nr:GHKL domain-containing protein [Bacteroidaceae bacterium]
MHNTACMKNEESILEQHLRQQEKLASLGLLTAGVIHEIQNPLNFVINFSKMSGQIIEDLQDEDDPEEREALLEDLATNIKKIQEHGERAINIVHDMLMFSRGKDDEWIPTDITALTEEFVRLSYHSCRVNLKDFNATLDYNFLLDGKQYSVIPKDLGRAVLNISNNAFHALWTRSQSDKSADYTPTFHVSLEEKDGMLQFTFRDNGCGMSDETKQRLYENFYTTKPVGQGTGLGMGIVQQIVEKHKGTIDLQSQENEGTTITVRVPLT